MSSVTQSKIITDAKPSEQLFHLSARLADGAALVSFALVIWQTISGTPLPGKPGWPEALLVLTVALTTLVSLTRQLPAQNVLLAAVIIGVVGGVAHGVGVLTAIPFGPLVFEDSLGPRLFGTLAWPMPALWVIVILNSRGVARLILRPWRKLRNYGFWLIGITTTLVVLFDLALEPFATKVNHYWLWLPTKFPFTWLGMPLTNSLGWLLTSLLILVLATPPLINKQSRSRKTAPNYQPLIIWLLAVALFATGAITHQLWTAAAFGIITALATTVFALRGARW